MAKAIMVFISYSHDSDEHRQSVLQLSEQLLDDGIECQIDQYINGSPSQGWQRWMEQQVKSADFVLLVCTPLYLKRYNGEDTNGGRGVTFEGLIISQSLYDVYHKNVKFIPVIPDDGSLENVPLPLKGFNTYRMVDQYHELYRVLTNQPAISPKKIGPIKKLPTNEHLTDKQEIEKNNHTHHYSLWLPFSVEQTNDKIQAECLKTDPVQTNSLPLASLIPFPENSQALKSLFELLFGDAEQGLKFLQQFPEKASATPAG